MRQMAAVLIIGALFLMLVGSRFQPSDADRLQTVSRLVVGKVRGALPPAAAVAGPMNLLRKGLPERLEDRVNARLNTDKRLDAVDFTVTAEGGVITLRGVVPNAAERRRAVALAENTSGVDTVTDELAVPE